MRNRQVARVLKVIHYLELHPQGISAREIHAKLTNEGYDCSPRTVYRDLEAVQAAFLPVTNEGKGEDAKWKLDSVASLSKSILFSYDELMALYLVRESLYTLRGTALYDHMDSFFSRIEKALGPRADKELEEFKQILGFKPASSWQGGVPQEILNTIHKACAEGHQLAIDYKSKSGERADRIERRVLGPESLYFADSGVYLIAKDLEAGIHKTYSLGRVVHAVMTDDPYESSGFSSKEFFKDSIGVLRMGEVTDVKIRIGEPIASYVTERRWHESQHITRLANGIELSLKVRVNDELARWVLGLGPLAEVVSPSALADLVGQLAIDTAMKYRGKKSA